MSRPTAKSADAYHHGDLREGLLAAAREALETTAPEDVSMKALAARLGVSQPAPYRHFASKEALLQAVAEDGFRRFRTALEAAAEAGGGLEPSALAYLRFARENPGVYRLMFASPLMRSADPQSSLAEASGAAFQFLLDRVGPHAPPERRQAAALWIWASLHGIVMLDLQGLLRGPLDNPPEAEDTVRELVAAARARASA